MKMAPRMGRSGEFEREIPRWSLKRTSHSGAKNAQSWSLHQVESLRVQKTIPCDSPFCHPLVRLLAPESVKAEPATEGTNLDDGEIFEPELRNLGRVGEVPSLLSPVSTSREELVVPDSPEDTWASNEPPRSSGRARRVRLRKASLNFAAVRNTDDIEIEDRLRSTVHGAAKNRGTCTFENAVSCQILDDCNLKELTGLSNLPGNGGSATFKHADAPVTESSFSTASGRPLTISASAMRKARLLFGDAVEEELSENARATDQRNLPRDTHKDVFADEDVGQVSFSTAGGKPLSVPASVTKKAKISPGDEEAEQFSDFAGPKDQMTFRDNRNVDVYNRNAMFTSVGDTVPLCNFSTGSGKPVFVSSSGLRNARLLLGDESSETVDFGGASSKGALCRDHRSSTFDTLPGSTFSTIRGKPIPVSSIVLRTARPPFRNEGTEDLVDNTNAFVERNLSDDSQDATDVEDAVPLSHFFTGSGKQLSVSSFAMKKAKALVHLSDEEDENIDARISGITTFGHLLPEERTAQNRSVLGNSKLAAQFSRAGRDRCHYVQPACNFFTASEMPGSGMSTPTEKLRSPRGYEGKENQARFGPLQVGGVIESNRFTADTTGRPGNLPGSDGGHLVSDTAMTAADGDRYVPLDGESNVPLFHMGQSIERHGGPSFRTGTGRIVTVSNDAIERAKVLLEFGQRRAIANESRATDRRSQIMSAEVPGAEPTFQTGSGRTVTISGEAMERAKYLLEDGEKNATLRESAGCYSTGGHPSTEIPSLEQSFRTPSGRLVTVSSEAMKRANALLALKPPLRVHPSSGAGRLDVAGIPQNESSTFQQGDGCGERGPLVRNGITLAGRVPLQHHQEIMKTGSGGSRSGDINHGLPMAVANRPPYFNLHNADTPSADIASDKSLSTMVDSRLRNVRPFKPPRQIGKKADVSFASRENQLTDSRTMTSCANSAGNPPRTPPAPKLLLPSRSQCLQHPDSAFRQGRMKLREYGGGPTDHDYNEVRSLSTVASLVSADLADDYRFRPVTGDWAGRSVGSLEVWRLLLGCGADPGYASKEWVENHYKWIVWTSFQRKFPRQATQKDLSMDTVIYELKRRYDMELSGRRSALRRITEGDSLASRTMVVYVSAVRYLGDEEGSYEHAGNIPTDLKAEYFAGKRVAGQQQDGKQLAKIEVTDGWYRLNAVLDAPLTKQLRRGKLKIGHKIRVCGANLCSCPAGTPPLEAFRDSFLALHINGTYRAGENESLGFCRGHCIPLAFRCIKADGGPVPYTFVGVKRVYPFLFQERSGAGISVMRSARAEESASNIFDSRRTKVLEETMAKLETSYNPLSEFVEKNEGWELFVALEGACDPEILLADMTAEQHKALAAYQAKQDMSRQAAFEDAVKEALEEASLESRHVKRLLKVRVSGLKRRSSDNDQEDQSGDIKEGMITIWEPSAEQNVQEGSVYCVSALKPGTWSDSRHPDQLQLQAFGSSVWRHVPDDVYENQFFFPYIARAPTRLSDMDEKFLNREFDVAAVVLHVGQPFSNNYRTNQWVFMSDGTAASNGSDDTWAETELLVVRVSMPSQAFVPVETSIVGSVIGYCNLLQQPKDHKLRLWVAEASELSVYSSNLVSRTRRHLRTAAKNVSKWAETMPWVSNLNLRAFVSFKDVQSRLDIWLGTGVLRFYSSKDKAT